MASVGCRSLRDRSANQKLVQARQLSLRGTDAIQRERYQDAELLFSEALKQSTLDERAHWGYASTLWERGDKAKAIQHMEESLRLSGSNPEYAVKLGEMYLEVGDHLKARKTAESVLAANRNHAAAWALLGDTHTAEKRWATAMECYHHALLIQADYPKVQLALAEVYRNIGKPERALAVLDRMVDLHDTARHDPVALLHRGLALSDLQRHDEASDALAKASERLPPQEVDKHLQIVRAQHRIGELVSARLTLGRIRENHAANAEVQRLQSMLDMSFAHLSDPVRPLQEPSMESVSPGIMLAQPGMIASQTMGAPTYSSEPPLLAQPVRTQDSWLRR
ncbi:tetratricopeptide repeat protein [Pirellulaceae bacterium SH467]|jgi:tetratricopeptide (TPR) repeat protein